MTSETKNRIWIVLIVTVLFLGFAKWQPWLGLLAGIGLMGWGVIGIAKGRSTPFEVVFPSVPKKLSAALFAGIGLAMLTVGSGELSDRWERAKTVEKQRQEEVAKQEEARKAALAQDAKLRSDVPAIIERWTANMSEVEALLGERKIREAHALLKQFHDGIGPALALQPRPSGLDQLVTRYESMDKSMMPTVLLLEASDELISKQNESRELIKQKDWVGADAALVKGLEALDAIEKTTGDRSYLPSSFAPARHRKEIESARRRIAPKVAAEEKKRATEVAYRVICGEKPHCSAWDGECGNIQAAVKKTAHDPSSIDVENCTDPVLTTKQCWVTTCDVRGKNAFGAKVFSRKTFGLSKLGVEQLE